MDQEDKASSDSGHLPFLQKALLNALMLGADSALAFSQLYEVPLLQTWGVPVALVSLYPVVAGPLALMLIQIVGHVTDRGPNHRRRKMAAVFLNTALFLFGFALIIAANVLKLAEPEKTGIPNAADDSLDGDSSAPPPKQMDTLPGNLSQNSLSTRAVAEHSVDASFSSPTLTDTPSNEADLLSLPTTAMIGLVGCILFCMGYDGNVSAIRSCVLSCTPRQDHTSLLAQALGMAALGGCITCVLGLIDLAPLLNANSGSLPAQTTVQLLVCAVLVIVSMVSTIAASKHTAERLDSVEYIQLTSQSEDEAQGYGAITESDKCVHLSDSVIPAYKKGKESVSDDSPVIPLYKHSVSIVSSGKSSDSDSTETGNGYLSSKKKRCGDAESEDSIRNDHTSNEIMTNGVQPSSKTAPTIFDAQTGLNSNEIMMDSVRPSSKTVLTLSDVQTGLETRFEHQTVSKPSKPSTQSSSSETPLQSPGRQKCDKMTIDMFIACLSLYMGSSVLYSYNAYVSDFLGRALFGGDPYAAKGSAELKAYEDGVSLASSGLLIVFCCYLIVSVLQDWLLRRLGPKLNFCLAHILMATVILTLTLSKQLAFFYVACVVYGFQRSALLTVPFVLANRYSQEKTDSEGGQSVGKAMAAMTCMIPLYYCTAYMLSGPLIHLTGYDAMPLLVAVGFSFLAAVIFMFHGVFD